MINIKPIVTFVGGMAVGAVATIAGTIAYATLVPEEEEDIELEDDFNDNFIQFAADEDVKKTVYSGQKDDENRPNCFDVFKNDKE